jgi:hypothetical protein
VERLTTLQDNSAGASLTVQNDDSLIRASIGSVETHGNAANGLLLAGATSLNAAATIGNVTTTGDRSSGIRIVGGSGTADLNFAIGSVTTSGFQSDGITLVTDRVGNASISIGEAKVTGVGSTGLYLQGLGLDLELTVGKMLAEGDSSAPVYAEAHTASVHATDTITSTGSRGAGIFLATAGNLDLTIDRDVSAQSDHATGVALQVGEDESVASVRSAGLISANGYFGTGLSGQHRRNAQRCVGRHVRDHRNA